MKLWKIWGIIQAVVGAGTSALQIVNLYKYQTIPDPPNITEAFILLYVTIALSAHGIYIFKNAK
jgi:hypothetical protein